MDREGQEGRNERLRVADRGTSPRVPRSYPRTWGCGGQAGQGWDRWEEGLASADFQVGTLSSVVPLGR